MVKTPRCSAVFTSVHSISERSWRDGTDVQLNLTTLIATATTGAYERQHRLRATDTNHSSPLRRWPFPGSQRNGYGVSYHPRQSGQWKTWKGEHLWPCLYRNLKKKYRNSAWVYWCWSPTSKLFSCFKLQFSIFSAACPWASNKISEPLARLGGKNNLKGAVIKMKWDNSSKNNLAWHLEVIR